MKIRAKANGNVLELPDEAAQVLLATGIYEAVTDDPSVTKAVTIDPPRYKRRDLRASP